MQNTEYMWLGSIRFENLVILNVDADFLSL